MSFGALNYLWVFVTCIIVFSGCYLFQMKRQKQMLSWIRLDYWKFIIPEFSKNKFKSKWIFMGLGIFFVLIALIRPQWGEHEELIESKGMDIIFALDLSNSMLSEDVNPSRLERAQSMIKKTMTQLADDRVGVIGFAGRAFLAIPLTNDFDYVAEIVDTLAPSAIMEQGTEIGEAIDVAIKAFERGGSDNRKTSRAIVMISDGEDYGKNAIENAAKIKEFGAGFFTFSVGTTEGAPIPVRSENGILQTYKKDRGGKTVLSRTNPDLLSKIANSGGGKFFELTNIDDASYILSRQLASFHRDSTKEQRKITKIDRFQYFLALGIILLMISLTIGYQPIFRKIAIILLLMTGGSQYSSAQTFGAYWKNKKGVNEYQQNSFEDSAKTFESARSNDHDNPILEFNQATALAKAKKDEDAIYHFDETTKKSLNQGDFETATKSLYNEGLLQKQNKNYDEAFHKLTNAIEMAKISKQPELENRARQALLQAAQEQQQQQQQQNQQQSSENQDKKEQKDQKEKKKDQGDKNEQKEQKEQREQKREFRSGTLSKDVAESIMNDLSDREKQLYQRKMKERKTKEIQNEKDW